MYSYCKESAFTLLELIITVLLLAIIASIAMPYFHTLRERQEVANLFPLLQQQLTLAKNSAATHHTNTVICSSISMKNCETNQWNNGIIVFFDTNQNKQLDANERILSATTVNLKYGTLVWRGGATNPHTITFRADTGLPRGSQGGFYYCSFSNADFNQYIPVSGMGHTRKEATKNC